MDNKFLSRKTKIILLILTIITIVCFSSSFTILAQSGYNFSTIFSSFKDNQLAESSDNESYPIDDSITELNLDLSSEDVKIIQSDSDEIKAKIENKSFLDTSAKNVLTSSITGSCINIKTTKNIHDDIKITLYVPYRISSVTANSASGNIDIDNYKINGDFNITTASGDISIKNSKSDSVHLMSASGNINLNDTDINNKSILKSSSGDINTNDTSLGEISASSLSGDIKLKLDKNILSSSLSTASGDINVSLPDDTACNVKFSTASGELRNMIKNQNGNITFNINTASGDANIE